MPDFDPAAFDQVTVLPPARVRHHLVRFDEGLTQALESGFRCDELGADNLVTQAQLLGFPSLAQALSGAVFSDTASPESVRGAARRAIEEARPKIAQLLSAARAA